MPDREDDLSLTKTAAPRRLERTTFRSSRLLDFATERELTAQIGHPSADWPLVIVKELVDNALDECEEAGVGPEIAVRVDEIGITVTDNGRGLPAEVIPDIVDFDVRVSSREAYVSPTRGAQGNALKTIIAMPFVLDGERGCVYISARGVLHSIQLAIDRIRQKPLIVHSPRASLVSSGAVLKVWWPVSASSKLLAAKERFLQIAEDFAWLNPHCTMTVDWFGERQTFEPTDRGWSKWKPSDPTSPHWYDQARLERLIAAYLHHDADTGRERTVRELVAEFRSLSSTAKQKQVLAETGLAREPLSALANGNGLDADKICSLLRAMQSASKPVKPELIGSLGREHFQRRFADAGCEMQSFSYERVLDTTGDGIPFVVEAAFGWCPDGEDRRLVTGVNWSPGILNPFRDLGFERSLDTLLTEQRASASEPVVVALHLACPRVEFLDRGKSSVALPDAMSEGIISAVERVTKRWAKQRKREEREASARFNRSRAMTRSRRVTVKEAAWEIMEQAYLRASADGTLPARPRQIYYAARKHILERTDAASLDGQYFSQTLLPDYVDEQGVEWNVVFDARGSLHEPHTDRSVPLGTLEVREHLEGIREFSAPPLDFDVWEPRFPTCGPTNRYGAILYVEKEGFEPLFEVVQLRERFDLLTMSNKGMSVTASRQLVDELCAVSAEQGIPLFTLHDFDTSGFSIAGTLTNDTRRYRFRNQIDVFDLGLRFDDIEGLETEPVSVPSPEKTADTLRRHGATEQEIDFLLAGQRVELNAMSSDQLVAMIERKLIAHGVRKVIPDKATLAQAYRRMHLQATVQARIDDLVAALGQHDVQVPPDLARQIGKALKRDPAQPWDEAFRTLVTASHKGKG